MKSRRSCFVAFVAGVALGAVPAEPAQPGAAAATLAARILPVGESAATPWSLHPGWFVLLALALPAITWLAFAWQRALDADPDRLRRRGLRELRRLLGRIRRSRHPSPQQLRSWLRATAKSWNVSVSAPTDRNVAEALQARVDQDEAAERWRTLWAEAEHALYSAEATIPDDWPERAWKSAHELTMPRRTGCLPNRLAHWLPSLAAAALLSLGTAAGSAGAEADASAAGKTPNLEAVGDAAHRALDIDWTDWAAHHDLAVYHMAHGDWGLAVAHASAAFAQNPRSASVRQGLQFALEQTGSSHRDLRSLLDGAGYERLSSVLSPAEWQRAALFGALVVAAGLSALVTALYLRHPALKPAGAGAVVAGSVLFAVSVSGFVAYGTLGRPTAAIALVPVDARPIPTDLIPRQETTPVETGTVVEMQRQFLGWQQIAFEHAPPAWVRGNVLLPLYTRNP